MSYFHKLTVAGVLAVAACMLFAGTTTAADGSSVKSKQTAKMGSLGDSFKKIWKSTGLNEFAGGIGEFFTGKTQAEKIAENNEKKAEVARKLAQEAELERITAEKHAKALKGDTKPFGLSRGLGQLLMIGVGLLLIYLAIHKGFEPLLLLPIGFGGILANIPVADIAGPEGFLGIIYGFGIKSGLFPLLIFMGVGAMTDFGPLLANPKTALLGAAAQFGIFTTLLGALFLSGLLSGIDFNIQDAAAIGIIGGADGPTSIFLASKLSPRLLGAIAVAAYSYMALVPIIQPPIIRMFTTPEERKMEMKQLRPVSRMEKIIFPLIVLGLCALLLPDACPLIGALMFGNLMRESGAVERLSNAAQNEMMNIVTILLGLSVGSKLQAEKFLSLETLGILALGLVAFCVGTAAGVILAKILNKFSKDKINPMIGGAGVSAVPMAARVVNKLGLEENPHNFLLMHAMGPNVAGVIGSAVAAGTLLAMLS